MVIHSLAFRQVKGAHSTSLCMSLCKYGSGYKGVLNDSSLGLLLRLHIMIQGYDWG